MDDDHSGRIVSDWTGDFGEVELIRRVGLSVHQEVKSNNASGNDAEDSLMSDEQEGLEVQSLAAPERLTMYTAMP